jgi:hypothetical protein
MISIGMGARSGIDPEQIESLSFEFGFVRPEEQVDKLSWERVLGNLAEVPDIQAAVAMQIRLSSN